MEDQKIKEYFNFDDTDLETNRQGQFSRKQIDLLTKARNEFGKDMRRTGLPFVLAAIVGPISAIWGRSMGLVWILIWGVGWTLLWGVIGWGFIEGSFTKQKFTLVQAKGPVKIAMKESYSLERRQTEVWNDLIIGRKKFEVETDLSKLMQRGDEYIAYYEKSLSKIVSLEFVSASEKQQQDKERTIIDFDAEAKKLRKHFQFTEADLMANQSGMLSEKQEAHINKEEKGGKTLGMIFGAALLLGGGLLAIPVLNWMKQSIQMPELWLRILWGVFGGIAGLLMLAMIAGGIFLIVSQLMGKNKYKLLSIRGRANLIKGYGDRRSHVYYDLHINGHEFDGNDSTNKAIIQDAEYIVYYIEGTDEIMSIELVSDNS